MCIYTYRLLVHTPTLVDFCFGNWLLGFYMSGYLRIPDQDQGPIVWTVRGARFLSHGREMISALRGVTSKELL